MTAVPFSLAGFEPIERLGSGGFGEVWLARQTNIDRRVAIKVGHAPIDDKTVQLRFERECIALGRLSGHPNIIDVHTAGQLDDGRPYLVLEYVGGGTLWQRLQSRALTEPELIRIGIELAAALSVAHESGILHRDLKPENILLRPSGEAVLGDFGIARLHDGAHTTSHAITASVAYAPPEILTGGSATAASDLYGLGVCMLASVIRGVPFVATADQSIHPIINRVLTERPPDLGQYGVSEPLSEVIQQLLAKDPADRPSPAGEVKRRLELLSAGPAALLPPTVPAGPSGSGQSGAGQSRAGQRGPAVTATAAPARRRPPRPQTTPAAPAPPPLRLAGPRDRSDRIRIIGAAFGAAVLMAGLIALAVTQLLGDDDQAPRATTIPTTTPDAGADTDTGVGTGGSAPAMPATSAPAGPTVIDPSGPLALPLQTADLDLGDNPVITPDELGPSSAQFCNNIPDTTGLLGWTGETTARSVGYPSVFQQLARFATAEQADAYVQAYVDTVDCAQWVIAADEANQVPEITVNPSIGTPAASYADDTRSVRFWGNSSGLLIYGRVDMVRRGAEVYLVSVTSITEADLDDVPGLLALALSRLGY